MNTSVLSPIATSTPRSSPGPTNDSGPRETTRAPICSRCETSSVSPCPVASRSSPGIVTDVPVSAAQPRKYDAVEASGSISTSVARYSSGETVSRPSRREPSTSTPNARIIDSVSSRYGRLTSVPKRSVVGSRASGAAISSPLTNWLDTDPSTSTNPPGSPRASIRSGSSAPSITVP